MLTALQLLLRIGTFFSQLFLLVASVLDELQLSLLACSLLPNAWWFWWEELEEELKPAIEPELSKLALAQQSDSRKDDNDATIAN